MAAYPTINAAVRVQFPWSREKRYLTITNDGETGVRYVRSERVTPLMVWDLTYPALTASEVTTLHDFFVAHNGRYAEFEFTDPETAIVYPKCRFDLDVFEVTHVDHPNHQSVHLVIAEYR